MRDNSATQRFENGEGDGVVFADYRRSADKLFIDHVEAPPALRGTGAAGLPMEAIVEQARAEGRTIVPLCGYAAAWLRRRERVGR
ncbi:MAG TPA: GNAT family N-acetyltransferase [Caulobacteraceae bacterium]